jgi:glutamine synthetase type III
VIGVGALACGGPEAYRAWSVTQTDARALDSAVAKDAAARKAALEREAMHSTCVVRPLPGVTCARSADPSSTGRCVVLPASATAR